MENQDWVYTEKVKRYPINKKTFGKAILEKKNFIRLKKNMIHKKLFMNQKSQN